MLQDVSFVGTGCAISQASASMMTDCLKGRDARPKSSGSLGVPAAGDRRDAAMPEGDDLVEKLEVFAGVREFPSRVKCASLAWHALRAALDSRARSVSTE